MQLLHALSGTPGRPQTASGDRPYFSLLNFLRSTIARDSSFDVRLDGIGTRTVRYFAAVALERRISFSRDNARAANGA